jgi:hypothetical protein
MPIGFPEYLGIQSGTIVDGNAHIFGNLTVDGTGGGGNGLTEAQTALFEHLTYNRITGYVEVGDTVLECNNGFYSNAINLSSVFLSKLRLCRSVEFR